MTYFTLFAAAALFLGITVGHLHVGLQIFMLI